MWPFLLILALVPMIFYWSDSAHDLFPGLAEYLPDREKKTAVIELQPEQTPTHQAGGEPGKWFVSQTQTGYVAWVISQDGHYRLAVGCYTDTPATLQITHLSGYRLGDGLTLNYQFGTLPLTAGAYAGDELVNATAQLKEVHLQSRSGDVRSHFTMPGAESNAVARNLLEFCPQTHGAQ